MELLSLHAKVGIFRMTRIVTLTDNNFVNQNKYRQPHKQAVALPNFSAKTSEFTKLEENQIMNILIKKYLGPVGNFFDYLSKTTGEIQNLVIQNIGTAFIAPIFIVHNFLSKEDEKSKKYTAWRQPISAAIAIPVSVASNYAVNVWFDDAATMGVFKKFDLRAMPPEAYLKRRYNHINKAFNKYSTHEEVLKHLDIRSKEILEHIPAEFKVNKEAFSKNYPNYSIFTSDIHKAKTKEVAKELLDPNNPKALSNITVKEYLSKNLGFLINEVDSTKLNKYDVTNKVNKMLAVDFLKAVGMNDVDEVLLRKFLGNNFYTDKFKNEKVLSQDFAKKVFHIFESRTNQQLKSLEKIAYKEIEDEINHIGNIDIVDTMHNLYKHSKTTHANQSDALNHFTDQLQQYFSGQTLSSVQRKIIARIGELLIPEQMQKQSTITLKNLLKVLDMDDDFYKHPMLDWKMDKFIIYLDQEIQPEKLKTQKSVMRPRLKPVEEFSKEHLDKLAKYAFKITENAAKKATSAMKNYTKMQGILISLIVLPGQATFLNWVYPRIMDAFFPKLAAHKAQAKTKGGD